MLRLVFSCICCVALSGCVIPGGLEPGKICQDKTPPTITFTDCTIDRKAQDMIVKQLENFVYGNGCAPCAIAKLQATGTLKGFCNGNVPPKVCARKNISESFIVTLEKASLTTEGWICDCSIEDKIGHVGPDTQEIPQAFLPMCAQILPDGYKTFLGDDCKNAIKGLTPGKVGKCTVKFESGATNWEQCCKKEVITPIPTFPAF